MDGGPTGGSSTARPLVFPGSELSLNLQTSANGNLRVAVLDEAERPYEGYLLLDCRPVRGDATAKRVAWRACDGVRGLRGKPVRLQVQMRHAKRYAFQFRD